MVEGQKVGKDENSTAPKFDEIVELNPNATQKISKLVARQKKSGIEKYDYQNNKYNIKIFNWFMGLLNLVFYVIFMSFIKYF